MNSFVTSALFLLLLVMPPSRLLSANADYNPLQLPKSALDTPLLLTVKDQNRSRDIPVRIFLPKSKDPAAVVVFSHGLGGSRDNNTFLGEHWSARGFAVVFMQHPGSDEAVWKEAKPMQRMGALQRAASYKNFKLRVDDVPALLNQLGKWNSEAGHSLAGRLDMQRIGMCGHSFGAVTTQAVSGQQFFAGMKSYTDPRIKAAIAFSPSEPKRGNIKTAFGNVNIPWMLMTGTHDGGIIGGATPASRLNVYPALSPGSKYELVLDKAEHSAFGEHPLPGEKLKKNPNHHRVILALSTAFWDAYLGNRKEAKTWLEGDGPKEVLESQDRWQWK